MKTIISYIKKEKEEELLETLCDNDAIISASLSEVRHFSTMNHWKESEMLSTPHYLKLELVVNDDVGDSIIETISKKCHTGTNSDGMIFCYDTASGYNISNKTFL